MRQPLCWITNSFDRSPAELLWVTSDAWAPLTGSLLNLSYGYGKLFVVPHETVGGQRQGCMSPLPVGPLDSGVMRGRFSSHDGQLYVCGMFAWAGSATEPGGFYRIRRTDKPLYVPTAMHARKGGLELVFTAPLDRACASDPARFAVTTWSIKRSANYGSEHFGERRLAVRSAELLADGRSVRLAIDELRPTMGMEIKYDLKGERGEPVVSSLHGTIHRLAE
jgi:hypothetical protein